MKMSRKLSPVILAGFFSLASVHAEELIKPPEPDISDSVQLSEPQDLRSVSPEIFQLIRSEKLRKASAAATKRASWRDMGSGPYPTNGGKWYFSDKLSAGYVPKGAMMETLKYYWNNRYLNGWDKQVSVMLYVTDGYTVYHADVTSKNSATLDTRGIPANYSVYIAMRVGNLIATLYKPPYIPVAEAYVYYKY
jgi:hypothetical protein